MKAIPIDKSQPPTGGHVGSFPIWTDELGYTYQPPVEIFLRDFISWLNEVPTEAIEYRLETLEIGVER